MSEHENHIAQEQAAPVIKELESIILSHIDYKGMVKDLFENLVKPEVMALVGKTSTPIDDLVASTVLSAIEAAINAKFS